MPDLTQTSVWLIAVIAAFCVGMSKTGFGGLGVISVTLFAMLWPAKASTGALLPLMIFADFLAVFYYRRHADWTDLARLMPATLLGIICGWWLMPKISDQTFTLMLGWLILGLMGLTILQRLYPILLKKTADHPAIGWLAGWLSGVVTMLANAAGAITAFYFLARRMDKMTFVGTAAWFFLVVNLAKVPFSVDLGLINRESLFFDAMLLPVVLFGGVAGQVLLKRVPQKLFEWITIGLAMVAALRLLVGA